MLDLLRQRITAHGPGRTARLLESIARVALVSALRNVALEWQAGRSGRTFEPLVEVQLAVTPTCDQDCLGCFSRNDRTGSTPDRETLLFLVDEAASCGATIVHVVGKGEPFATTAQALDLLDVVDARPHLFFTIATNGRSIEPAVARRLASLGNALTLVSLDGPEAAHDERRGQGSFALATQAIDLLERHGALHGFSSMISELSYRGATSLEFLRERAAAGSVLGVFSRYFPLSGHGRDRLALSPAAAADHGERLARARAARVLPLFDFDEAEEFAGCRSRAGLSVYLDGCTGRVSPCIRVPFGPPDCRLVRGGPTRLADVLVHPFFARYRTPSPTCPAWCGGDPDAELAHVICALEQAGCPTHDAAAYRARWADPHEPTRSPSRLPDPTTAVQPGTEAEGVSHP